MGRANGVDHKESCNTPLYVRTKGAFCQVYIKPQLEKSACWCWIYVLIQVMVDE